MTNEQLLIMQHTKPDLDHEHQLQQPHPHLSHNSSNKSSSYSTKMLLSSTTTTTNDEDDNNTNAMHRMTDKATNELVSSLYSRDDSGDDSCSIYEDTKIVYQIDNDTASDQKRNKKQHLQQDNKQLENTSSSNYDFNSRKKLLMHSGTVSNTSASECYNSIASGVFISTNDDNPAKNHIIDMSGNPANVLNTNASLTNNNNSSSSANTAIVNANKNLYYESLKDHANMNTIDMNHHHHHRDNNVDEMLKHEENMSLLDLHDASHLSNHHSHNQHHSHHNYHQHHHGHHHPHVATTRADSVQQNRGGRAGIDINHDADSLSNGSEKNKKVIVRVVTVFSMIFFIVCFAMVAFTLRMSEQIDEESRPSFFVVVAFFYMLDVLSFWVVYFSLKSLKSEICVRKYKRKRD